MQTCECLYSPKYYCLWHTVPAKAETVSIPHYIYCSDSIQQPDTRRLPTSVQAKKYIRPHTHMHANTNAHTSTLIKRYTFIEQCIMCVTSYPAYITFMLPINTHMHPKCRYIHTHITSPTHKHPMSIDLSEIFRFSLHLKHYSPNDCLAWNQHGRECSFVTK